MQASLSDRMQTECERSEEILTPKGLKSLSFQYNQLKCESLQR
jgi:hypothetical protein